MKFADISFTPMFCRLRKSVKEGNMIRLDRDLYTFPENLKKIDAEWLGKTKEEKVLSIVTKLKVATHKDISDLSKLGQTQMYRAINNLLEDRKIIRVEKGMYQRQ